MKPISDLLAESERIQYEGDSSIRWIRDTQALKVAVKALEGIKIHMETSMSKPELSTVWTIANHRLDKITKILNGVE